MDVVLKDLVGIECGVFIDDLIVFSRKAENMPCAKKCITDARKS